MLDDRDRAPIASPTERLGFLIYRTGLMVSRIYEARMRPLGFLPAEVGLMTYLASHGIDHVRALSRAIGVSPQTIVNLSRSLVRRGLVRRGVSESDQRNVTIELTGDGKEAVAQADAIAKAFDAEIARIVGQSSEAAILQGLSKLLAASELFKPAGIRRESP